MGLLRYLFLFVLLCACSCSFSPLEEALVLAGENRKELEKVLEHYSQNPVDSVKWQAACFLIENMPGHYTVEGGLIDVYRNRIDRDSADFLTKKMSITANGEVNLKFCGEYGISEESIQHEFYHLYQVFHNQISTGAMMEACSLNMEFEQALFQDIVKYVEAGGDWDAKNEDDLPRYEHNWACWESVLNGDDIIGNQVEYMDWLGSLTHNGVKYPVNIDRKEFNEWTLFFPSVKTEYIGFVFDENYCLTVLDALN